MGKLNRTTEEVNELMDRGAEAIADKVGSKGTAPGAEVFNDYEGGNAATGTNSHAEGLYTTAQGNSSHTEGSGSSAVGASSHAEGSDTSAAGHASHAEGESSQAVGDCSHAEGGGTRAEGDYSHAEGNITRAAGTSSHAEGHETTANGTRSHAEGGRTIAEGDCSHTEGLQTQATNTAEHAEGLYNASHTGTRHSIGIGTSDTARKNAVEVMDDGRVFVHGIGGYDGTNPGSAGTLQGAVAETPLHVSVALYKGSNAITATLDRPLGDGEELVLFRLTRIRKRKDLSAGTSRYRGGYKYTRLGEFSENTKGGDKNLDKKREQFRLLRWNHIGGNIHVLCDSVDNSDEFDYDALMNLFLADISGEDSPGTVFRLQDGRGHTITVREGNLGARVTLRMAVGVVKRSEKGYTMCSNLARFSISAIVINVGGPRYVLYYGISVR